LTSDDNGHNWQVFYTLPDLRFGNLQDNLKRYQDDKLSFYAKSSTSAAKSRSVFVLDPEEKEIVKQYTPPNPDQAMTDNWVNSYAISQDAPDHAVISVGYKIGTSIFEKTY